MHQQVTPECSKKSESPVEMIETTTSAAMFFAALVFSSVLVAMIAADTPVGRESAYQLFTWFWMNK